MIKLDEIYAMITSGKIEYLKIIHDRQHDSTNGFWYVKTSMFGDEIEIENSNNLCIYHEIYKYLLNKYGEDNVDLIIPRGVLSERTGVELFAENLYVVYVPQGFSSKIYEWIDKINWTIRSFLMKAPKIF